MVCWCGFDLLVFVGFVYWWVALLLMFYVFILVWFCLVVSFGGFVWLFCFVFVWFCLIWLVCFTLFCLFGYFAFVGVWVVDLVLILLELLF